MPHSVGILICSDRCAAGTREDGCLPIFRKQLEPKRFDIVSCRIVPDNPTLIRKALKDFINQKLQLIFTSGGTGCAPRDHTPDVTMALLDKPTPGVDEAIRAFSRQQVPNAIYSRAVSGVAADSFIVNLPGSPKAVAEILRFLLPTIEHPLRLIAGSITDCSPVTRLS